MKAACRTIVALATATAMVWGRYCLLALARCGGRMRRALFGGWRRPAIVLAATIGALWLLVDLARLPTAWLSWDRVVGVFAVVMLARWVLSARKRVVIGNFVDYTGGDPKPMPGLSSLLQLELGRLYGLVNVVDQSRAVPEALVGPQGVSFDEHHSLEEADGDGATIIDRPLVEPAPIKAEDLTDVLSAVLSVETTLNLGPVKIPIGALASVVARIAQGPRVTGSFHHSDDGVVLSARTVGALTSQTWRVDGKAPALDAAGTEASVPLQPEDLIDELAIRIFTDLALTGSFRWQATWTYVDGLRAYRSCLGAKRDRRIHLEEAKAHFIETIANDNRFDLAFYNLAVVATELQQRQAAEGAFLTAIHLDRRQWAPYYGLAQLYLAEKRYDEVLPLCGRIIQLGRLRAEAYHLRAVALRRLGRFPEAIRDRGHAVHRSWLDLCSDAFRGRPGRSPALAATSLRNLATVRAYQAKDRRSPTSTPSPVGAPNGERRPMLLRLSYLVAACELRQGLALDPGDAELHFELGKLYAARRKWHAACQQLEKAVEIVPDRPRFWIQLARAYGEISGAEEEDIGKKLNFALRQATARPSEIAGGGFDRLAKIYAGMGQHESAARICRIQSFEADRRLWERETPARAELENRLGTLGPDDVWQATHTCLHLIRSVLDQPACALKVARRLDAELEYLREHHPDTIKRHGVYTALAEAYHAAESDDVARSRAEAAVLIDPLSSGAWAVLAAIHTSLACPDQAVEAWRSAAVCDPDSPRTNTSLGECLVRSALSRDVLDRPQARRLALQEACQHLRNGLKLTEFEQSGVCHEGSVSTRDDEGRARYWLGRALEELGDHFGAVVQFQACVAIDFHPAMARLRLGQACLRAGRMCQAERAFDEIGDEAERLATAGTSTVGPSGDELSVHDLRAWAQVHMAESKIDRDAGVSDAIDSLQRLAKEIQQDGSSAVGLLAACADWEGWAWFLVDQPDRALDRLNESIRLEASALAHHHLAQVHAALAADCDAGATTPEAPTTCRSHRARAQRHGALARCLGLAVEDGLTPDDVLLDGVVPSRQPATTPAHDGLAVLSWLGWE